MLASDLLADVPAPVDVRSGDVLREIEDDLIVVVLDDDPTGTQSVSGLPVLTRWDASDVRAAMATGARAVYILTNTRSLDEDDAAGRVRDVVRVASSEAARIGRRPLFVSRGDSTLRGHFPLETDVIAAEVSSIDGGAQPLTLVIPAFPEAGRVTVGSTHYWIHGDTATPVGETAFASDATFGFSSSELRDWVAEKSGGRISRDAVTQITLDDIRRGASAVQAILDGAPDGSTIVADAIDETDMRVVATAVHRSHDRAFVLRVGPPYVRAHLGQDVPHIVTPGRIGFPNDGGGLIVVGSHVPLTTAQLQFLTATRPETRVVSLDAARLISDGRADYVEERIRDVLEALPEADVVVHTSRDLIVGRDGDESLAIARLVSRRLVDLVQAVVARRAPRFIVAKGGITSSDIATDALHITRATVVGPMLPGLVSLWRPESGPAVGIPYVVFPGNVGDERSLLSVVTTLTSSRTKGAPQT